ncbi:hypothetical protein C7S14_2658 [Burkholderia cepacia]|nr:hypothetical protein C7S14_2658 [Burkholderia cepacia]
MIYSARCEKSLEVGLTLSLTIQGGYFIRVYKMWLWRDRRGLRFWMFEIAKIHVFHLS